MKQEERRQTDRQIDRQTDRHINIQKSLTTIGQTNRNRQLNGQHTAKLKIEKRKEVAIKKKEISKRQTLS